MNNIFPSEASDIGTDPTTVEVIDSLDVLPAEKPNDDGKPKPKGKKSTTPNPDKKPHETLKKVIFIIAVLLLMAGVAFGVYYYLSLGTKNKQKKAFTLKDIQLYVGSTVSKNITDYGDFSNIDLSTCLINGLDSVDTSTVGTFEYSVTCNSTKHTAKIEIIEAEEISFTTRIIYKGTNDIPAVNDFISTETEYNLLTDEEKLKNYLKSEGGPYGINMNVSHESGKEKEAYAVLYVIKSTPAINLLCTSKEINKNNYEYSVTDYFVFDDSRNNLGYSLRIYNYKFSEQSDFDNAILNVMDNKISIDNHEDYFIMDTLTNTISIVTKLSDNTLKAEYKNTFPTTYAAINSYYTNTKNYTCSN